MKFSTISAVAANPTRGVSRRYQSDAVLRSTGFPVRFRKRDLRILSSLQHRLLCNQGAAL